MADMDKGLSLLLVAILATVAHDVGGLFIGKAMGHRPLSSASPNKTVEGLLGGMACAFLVPVILVGMLDMGPWAGFGAGLLLGIGAAVAAPLGDLCQSVLKRDLGVKDMGSLLPGHGGVLDRFDAMLFVLPTVLWLTLALGPLGVG
jgi:phosphatidate cytidylyltransferase